MVLGQALAGTVPGATRLGRDSQVDSHMETVQIRRSTQHTGWILALEAGPSDRLGPHFLANRSETGSRTSRSVPENSSAFGASECPFVAGFRSDSELLAAWALDLARAVVGGAAEGLRVSATARLRRNGYLIFPRTRDLPTMCGMKATLIWRLPALDIAFSISCRRRFRGHART